MPAARIMLQINKLLLACRPCLGWRDLMPTDCLQSCNTIWLVYHAFVPGYCLPSPGIVITKKPMYLMNSTDIRKYQSLSLVPYRDCSKNPLHSPDRSIPLRCLVFITVIHFHLGHYCTLYYQDVIFMTFVTYISTYQDTSKVNVVAIPWCVSIINEDNTICYPIQWDWIKY